MTERRKEQRVISTFKSAYVRSEGALHFVTLRNISETGICFDAFPGVEVGAEIEFCIDSGEPRPGVVRWVRGGRFGVRSRSETPILSRHLAQRPRAVRLPLSLKARLFVDGRCREVGVHNLSLRGICVDSAPGMRLGQLVSVEVGNRSFEQATVRWQRGERAGICFAQPMELGRFRDLVEAVQEPAGSAAAPVRPARLMKAGMPNT